MRRKALLIAGLLAGLLVGGRGLPAQTRIDVGQIGLTASPRLVGRSTAGSGAGEEISIGSGLTLSGGTLTATGGGTITGSGTTGKIPKWSSASALTDSIVTESSGQIQVNGTLSEGTISGENWRVAATMISTTGGNGVQIGGTDTNGHGVIVPSGTNKDLLLGYWNGSAWTETARIHGSNVGIGTTSPAAKLDIFSNGNAINVQPVTTTNTTYGTWSNAGGSARIAVESSTGGSIITGGLAYAAVLANANNQPLQLATNNTAQLTIAASGGVSIGNTTDPGAKNLSLSGTLLVNSTQSQSGTNATYNDFALNAGVFRLKISDSGVTASITGIAGGTDGRILIIVNDSAATVSIIKESASSTAANRIAEGFNLSGNGGGTTPGGSLLLVYDGASSRWWPVITQ